MTSTAWERNRWVSPKRSECKRSEYWFIWMIEPMLWPITLCEALTSMLCDSLYQNLPTWTEDRVSFTWRPKAFCCKTPFLGEFSGKRKALGKLLTQRTKIGGTFGKSIKIDLVYFPSSRLSANKRYGKVKVSNKYTIRPEGRGNIGHSRPVVRIVWPEGASAPEGQTIRTNWSGMTDFASARGSDCSYHIHTHIMHCWQMLFCFNRLQFKSKSNSDQLLRSGLVSLLINTPA